MSVDVSVAPADAAVLEALTETALSLNSSLELTEVLTDLVRRARRVLGADRASVLLVGPDGRLVPAASAARTRDPDLWARFQALDPLDASTVPFLSELFRMGEVVVIHDAASSGFLSPELTAAFDLKSVAIAPLVVRGEPCGALVVDHRHEHRVFDEQQIRTLEALAALAATAVRNARAYTAAVGHAVHLDTMLRVTAALNAAPTVEDVLRSAMDGMLDVLGGDSCSVNLLDGAHVTTLASRGPGQPSPGQHTPNGIRPSEQQRIRKAWSDDPLRPLMYSGSRRSALLADCPELQASGSLCLVPFAENGAPRGFVLVGWTSPVVPEPAQHALAASVAGQVWLALERARLHEALGRRLQHLEILVDLSDELAISPNMGLVLERLAPPVRSAVGAELIDVLLCDPRAARLFSTPAPHGATAALVRSWRNKARPRPREVDGLLAVPMQVDEKLVGILRVRPLGRGGVSADDEGVLLTIARGVASVVSRAALRAEIASGERELAVAAERERIARDLHDTLGQLLFTIGLEVGECAAVVDESLRERLGRIQGTVSQANAEMRQAIHAMSFLDRGGHDLVRSLRTLVREARASAPFQVNLKVTGTPVRLSPGREEALFRVAHEALTNVERHARASVVLVHLAFTGNEARLVVRDDGIGMTIRPGGPAGMHFGLRTMRRRMTEVGGSLDISACSPHGLRLVATVTA